MKLARLSLAALLCLLPASARAHEAHDGPPLHVGTGYKECFVKFAPELTQEAFGRFVREFGSVSAFDLAGSPRPLGRGHVAIAIEDLGFGLEDHAAAWNDTFAHPDAEHDLGDQQLVPSVRVRAGVNDRLDAGAFFTRNPWSNYGWFGLEAWYALARRGEGATADLSVRAAYTRTLYVQDMRMQAFTADLAVGRPLNGWLSSYVAAGGDLVLARETSAVVDLESESPFVPHVLGGLEARAWRFTLGAQARLAALNGVKLRVGTAF